MAHNWNFQTAISNLTVNFSVIYSKENESLDAETDLAIYSSKTMDQ